MPGWIGSAQRGCRSLVPPMLWAGSAGLALWAGSRGAARGLPWVRCRGGCSDCWILGCCPGGRVRVWRGTWESQLHHGHGGWGHAASPKGSVALKGEGSSRQLQLAGAPLLSCCPVCPIPLRRNTAPHSCTSSRSCCRATQADVRALVPGHGKVQPLCCQLQSLACGPFPC